MEAPKTQSYVYWHLCQQLILFLTVLVFTRVSSVQIAIPFAKAVYNAKTQHNFYKSNAYITFVNYIGMKLKSRN